MQAARIATALLLLAGPAAAEQAPVRTPGGSTVVVPRSTVTVEPNVVVSQPNATVTPQPSQPQRPRRRVRRPAVGSTGNSGYSSFLTGPIDLRRPPPAR